MLSRKQRQLVQTACPQWWSFLYRNGRNEGKERFQNMYLPTHKHTMFLNDINDEKNTT